MDITCHGNNSHAHLGGGAYKNINLGMFKMWIFFFIFQIFSRALKVFIKPFHPWSYSAKNQWFKAGEDWVLPTYILYTTLAKTKV